LEERKDKLGRRYCTDQGKRVPCPRRDKPKAERPAKATVADVAAHVKALREKGATPEGLAKAGEMIAALTVAQLGELKKSLGVKASGRKAELVAKIKERALAAVRAGAGGKGAEKAPAAPAAGGEQTGGRVGAAEAERRLGGAVANALLYRSRVAGEGFADISALRGELERAAPGMSREQQDDLIWALHRSGAIELHKINEQQKLSPADRAEQLRRPGASGQGDDRAYGLIAPGDSGKVGPVVREWVAKATAGGKGAGQ
jgi:hypothetical protein